MDITCNRCHQTVQAETCYCSYCGLPQLVYSTDGAAVQAQPERWDGAIRDASSIAWKPALSAALKLAIPAGVLCALLSERSFYGVFWMSAAATWAVALYVRSQKPAWITIGAGARIGLVTGLLGGWLAFGVCGSLLFLQRFVFHQSAQIDAQWKSYADLSNQVNQQLIQQCSTWMTAPDLAKSQANQAGLYAWMLTPEGHAGFATFQLFSYAIFLILFAVAGGALAARMLGRSRQPEL